MSALAAALAAFAAQPSPNVSDESVDHDDVDDSEQDPPIASTEGIFSSGSLASVF